MSSSTKNLVVVDIADMYVSTNPNDELVTYSLGSCIGVVIHDPVAGVGGMIHCMLPLSSCDQEKAKIKPCMFVDTGMNLFLGNLFKSGLTKANAVFKVAGGSAVLDTQGLFRIGERNYTIFRKFMWKNGLMIKAEDVGGNSARTVRLHMDTGKVTVRTGGSEVEL